MKDCSLLLAAAFSASVLLAHAAPIEEIDLSAVDDAAEERAKSAKVERTQDGYIDVVCDDAPLSNVLQQFRRTTRMNILNSDSTNLSRRVSASLYHVPWCSALQSILGLADFKMNERNGIWYVSEKTAEEIKCTTRFYVLKHASAVDVMNFLNEGTVNTTYEQRNAAAIKSTVKDPSVLMDNAAGTQDRNSSVKVMRPIEGKCKAIAYPNTNTLVLTGPEADVIACEDVIREIDRPAPQVYIEARFIELSTEAMHKLGVQWDQLKSWGVTAKGLKAGYQASVGKAADYGTGLTDKSVNNNNDNSLNTSITDNSNGNNDSNESTMSDGTTTTASKSLTSSSTKSKSTSTSTSKSASNSESASYAGLFPTSIGEAAGAGASAADMAWENAGTFAGQLSADDFQLAISAFEQMQEGKMFSNPRIIVTNGKEARVDMTTKEPNVEVKSEYGNQYATTPTVSTELRTIPGNDKNLFAGEAFFSYGITLSVTPRVSPTGLISVSVIPTISEKKEDKKVSGAAAGSVYTSYPIINIKSINTEFTMKDGATAVIGGLTQTQEGDVDSGIPYLRKIPWIGPKLFGWQSRQKVQAEILVLVTVGIANPETLQKDAGLPTNAVLGREYVEGRQFEPGERPDALKNIQNVDTRTLDEIRKDPYQMKDDDNAFGDDEMKEQEKKEPAVEKPAEAPAPEPVATEPAAEAPKPVETTKPVETAKPVEEPQPVETPKPVAEQPAAEAVTPAAKPEPAPAPKKNIRRRH